MARGGRLSAGGWQAFNIKTPADDESRARRGARRVSFRLTTRVLETGLNSFSMSHPYRVPPPKCTTAPAAHRLLRVPLPLSPSPTPSKPLQMSLAEGGIAVGELPLSTQLFINNEFVDAKSGTK